MSLKFSHLCSPMNNNIFKYFLSLGIVVFLLFPVSAIAQDMSWWNNKHNWDGATPWFRMMTTSAAYMGPNALPIPEILEGKPNAIYEMEIRPEAHLSKGDQTYDLFTSIKVPLGNRASFEAFLVPIEYYKMDTITRDERLARNYDAKGFAGGDFWFGTNVQVFKEHNNIPNVQMSFYFKTASGTVLSDARYTDAPAYYVLVNAGKDISSFGGTEGNEKYKLRLFGSLGTYIWQTHSDFHNQDDAWVYGLGLSLQEGVKFARIALAGYQGYLNNGDRPSVVRMQIGTRRIKAVENKHLFWSFRYEIGLNDFKYHTLGLGLTYSL